MGGLTATLSTHLQVTSVHIWRHLNKGQDENQESRWEMKKISNKFNCLSRGDAFYSLVEHNHNIDFGKGYEMTLHDRSDIGNSGPTTPFQV